MLRHLIAFCLGRRPLVLAAFAAFLALGYVAFTTLNIEAYPDPAPPIIEIIAQGPGQSLLSARPIERTLLAGSWPAALQTRESAVRLPVHALPVLVGLLAVSVVAVGLLVMLAVEPGQAKRRQGSKKCRLLLSCREPPSRVEER